MNGDPTRRVGIYAHRFNQRTALKPTITPLRLTHFVQITP
jgi:hypothetical protein